MVEFFSIALGIPEEAEIIDLFAVRYGWTVRDIELLDVTVMYSLIKRIRDAETAEILRRQWLAYLPLMAMGFLKNMTFEDYKARSLVTVDTRPTAEILAEVEQIRAELKGE